ncbi:ATP-binding protein [Verrucomicrobiota bacterium]
MYKRILKCPPGGDVSFFLFGPRGTGKTTWLKDHFCKDDSVYLDLLDDGLYTELSSRPKRLETLARPSSSGWVVLDEIQRVPALLNEVHRMIESAGFRFAMTGSSARSLRKKGVNLLAGRAQTYHMHPLTAFELQSDFSLKHALRFGHLPSVFAREKPADYLKSYVRTYLREEVLQEGLARSLANFTRFLETASFSQGSPVNIAEIARESALNRKVVDSYFNILEDLLIGCFVPVFAKRARRKLVIHPKFYFFDAGVYRSIRPMGPLDSPEEAEGLSLETLCFQELKAVNESLSLEYDLYYWRTSNGVEVDFILYGPRGILAFEVKRSARYTKKDLAGLRAFSKDYPSAKCFLLYGGDFKREEYGISILPLEKALPGLPAILSNTF